MPQIQTNRAFVPNARPQSAPSVTGETSTPQAEQFLTSDSLAPTGPSLDAELTALSKLQAASGVAPVSAELEGQAEITAGDSVDDQVWVPSPSSVLVKTASTKETMKKLSKAISSGEFVMLTGETGAGKTAAVKFMAHLTNRPLRRVNLHDQTDETELFGGYVPGADGGFVWKDGVITSAIREGHWLLLDEINLADQAVLERLNPLLDGDGYIVLNEKEDQERVSVHDKTRVFATRNPASYEGRKKLSAAMNDRFQRKLFVNRMPDEELVEVLQQDFRARAIVDGVEKQIPGLDKSVKKILKAQVFLADQDPAKLEASTVRHLEKALGGKNNEELKQIYLGVARGKELKDLGLSPEAEVILSTFQNIAGSPPASALSDQTLRQLAILHNKMVESTEGRLLGKKGGPYHFTLRDLLKLTKRVGNYKSIHPEMSEAQLAWLQARDIYQARFMESKDRLATEKYFQAVFGDESKPNAGAPSVGETDGRMERLGDKVKIGDTVLAVNPAGGPYVPGPKTKLVETPGTVAQMNQLARAVAMDEPVLLVGPTAAGKTARVRWLAHETNNEFRRVNLSNHTDTSDLIGGYYPAVDVDQDRAKEKLEAITSHPELGPALEESLARLGAKSAAAFQQLRDGTAGLNSEESKAFGEEIRDQLRLVLGDQELRAQFEESEKMSLWRDLEGTFQTVPGKFEWRDGIIVEAMKKGQWIVLDEINLAEPAVLEGLNSLLDNDRALVLTDHLNERVKAHPNFRIFATANPATNEYGGRKKLSPAMRNRFTEQWSPEIKDKSEIQQISQSWIDEFSGKAQKALDTYANTPAEKRSRELGEAAVSAQAWLKADLSKLAEVVTDFQLEMKRLSDRQEGKPAELPTAKADGYHYTLRGLRAFLKSMSKNIGKKVFDIDAPSEPPKPQSLKEVFLDGVSAYYADGLSRQEDRLRVEQIGQTYAEEL